MDNQVKKYAIAEKITVGLMFVIFVAVSFMLFWKCKFGYAQVSDEGFYPTIAYRLLQGDKLLYEEWHVIQLIGVIFAPLLKLFLMITGSTDGVYIASRYAYTVCKIAMAIFIYFRLKRFNKIGAYISALIILIYAGYGIMALSYNNIGIGGVLLALLLLMNSQDDVKAKICWVLAGLSLSASVLAIPTNALLYIAYIVAVIVISKRTKKLNKTDKTLDELVRMSYSYKALIYVSIGVIIALMAFLIYTLSNASLSQIIETIPYIFTDDTAHQAKGLYRLTLAYIVRILICNHHNYAVFASYIMFGIVIIINACDKKKKEHELFYITVLSLIALIMLLIFNFTENYINYVVYVPNVLAIMLTIVSSDKNSKEMLALFIVPGIVLSYSEYVASSTGATGIANASCVATVGSVMIITNVMQRCISKRDESNVAVDSRFAVAATAVFIAVVIASLIYYRVTFVFWEGGGIPSLTETIDYGPAKGLRVTVKEAENYDNTYNDTESIREMSSDTLVVYDADPSLWIAGSQRCGSYTPHFQRVSSLEKYYEIHPDKIADVMYIQYDDGNEAKVEELMQKYGYQSTLMSAGWILTR